MIRKIIEFFRFINYSTDCPICKHPGNSHHCSNSRYGCRHAKERVYAFATFDYVASDGDCVCRLTVKDINTMNWELANGRRPRITAGRIIDSARRFGDNGVLMEQIDLG